ncbi:MAG: hypothetical protein GY866_23770 [Proteobacteria bacterium]|nr:hypothetical protein [Pseudomonadota bacterium]
MNVSTPSRTSSAGPITHPEISFLTAEEIDKNIVEFGTGLKTFSQPAFRTFYGPKFGLILDDADGNANPSGSGLRKGLREILKKGLTSIKARWPIRTSNESEDFFPRRKFNPRGFFDFGKSNDDRTSLWLEIEVTRLFMRT